MKKIIMALALGLAALQGYSQHWGEANVAGLYGNGFLLPSDLDKNWERTTLTLEYAGGWNHGDFFTFLDIYDIGESATQDYYFEWHPRFYLDELINLSEDNKIIEHIGVATQINVAPAGNVAYLAGPMIDFKVPGAIFFQTSWMIRQNPDLGGVSFQNTTAFRWWFGKKLNYDNPQGALRRFFIGGFFDVKSAEGTESAWFIFQPQLLMHFNTISFGTEFFCWTNKFGVEGKGEYVPQLMVRWVL